VPVHPGTAGVQQDRPAGPGAYCPVDGPADCWRERDQDDLGATLLDALEGRRRCLDVVRRHQQGSRLRGRHGLLVMDEFHQQEDQGHDHRYEDDGHPMAPQETLGLGRCGRSCLFQFIHHMFTRFRTRDRLAGQKYPDSGPNSKGLMALTLRAGVLL